MILGIAMAVAVLVDIFLLPAPFDHMCEGFLLGWLWSASRNWGAMWPK